MTTEIQKWADVAMFKAEPMQVERAFSGAIIPKVHLLWMTEDPLGANAAMGRMYNGMPTYNLGDITREERMKYWNDSLATWLKAPLEAIKLHFFIEGVTRSFTHQMVRQRTAVYAQESLRFAVKEDSFVETCSMPPSIAALAPDAPARVLWEEALVLAEERYLALINSGIPAEDARGLIPHAMTTRINYVTDLRNLADHAGNRLCTQAQFEWRIVWLGILDAIRNYKPDSEHSWQYEIMARSNLFRPVCFQRGSCPFGASFDRHCKIKSRVDQNQAAGRPSTQWGSWSPDTEIPPIETSEWMMDSSAARIAARPGSGGHD